MAFSVIDPKEKERLLRTFADNIHKSSLREFSKKHGYGDGYLRILFKEDLEEDEYKYLQESTEIKENQVLLNAIPPAAPKEENLYLDFDEFYAYLATEVYKRIQVEPAEEKEYLKLLVVIRDTLGLQEMIPTVTDPEEKEILLRTFASHINKSSLKEFSKKQGYGREYTIILFKEDLEEDEYAFLQELTEIKENQVLLNATPPAAPKEENLYLDFDEFYAYLATEVEKRIQAEPVEEKEYLKLLAAVRDTLGLQEMIPTVTDSEEKEVLLRTFANNIDKRCLRKFAKKQGCGDEYIIILFKEDLEEDEYAFLQELTEIKEDQVLLTAGFTEEENLYLDFDEFYVYLATEVEKRIQAEPAEEKEYLKLLAAVRDTLGLPKVVPTVIEPKGKERLLRTFESNIHKLLVGVKKFWN